MLRQALIAATCQQGIAHRHATVEEIFPPRVDTKIVV
jgi:hypothetical protein